MNEKRKMKWVGGLVGGLSAKKMRVGGTTNRENAEAAGGKGKTRKRPKERTRKDGKGRIKRQRRKRRLGVTDDNAAAGGCC